MNDFRNFPEINYFVAIAVALIVFFLLVSIARAEIDMDTIGQIESSNNALSYNKVSGATGKYQITKICLADYNAYNKEKFSITDMFNEQKCFKVANWYMNKRIPQLLKHYGHADTTRNRLIAYNWGIKNIGKPLPKETRDYILKYERG